MWRRLVPESNSPRGQYSRMNTCPLSCPSLRSLMEPICQRRTIRISILSLLRREPQLYSESRTWCHPFVLAACAYPIQPRCNRQIAASDLLVKTGDITRSTVQKAVVVLASKPIFGPIRLAGIYTGLSTEILTTLA